MKRTIWMILAMTVGLALLCGAAQAWSGSGTESDPWLIQSAADLVSLRDYVAATEGATNGKYFLQTADISLSAYCGTSKGDFAPIGVWERQSYDYHVFDGIYDGGGYAITDLYIANGGDGYGLFAELEVHGTIKNLSVTGYVKGGMDVGGIVGHSAGSSSIANCHFSGTVSGNGTVGGIVGFSNGSLENCHFSGIVTGIGDIRVGGIVGDSGGTLIGCTVSGDITGSSEKVGGIAGSSWKGVIKNCTYQSGTVTGNDQVGGIVGLGNAQLIENCISYGNVSSATNRAGGIAGETCGPITGCENFGQVSSTHYAGGITGHTFSGVGLTGTVENCKNHGDITVNELYVGGIVGGAEVPITNCENHGKIQGDEHVGGIAGDSDSTVTGCTNDGLVMGEYNVGFIVGGHGGSVVTLKPNGAPGNDIVVAMDPLFFSVAPECPFTHESESLPYLPFFAWNTKADGTGTWYQVGDAVSSTTLYAIWMDWDSTVYETLDGEGEYTNSYLLDSSFVDTGVTGLPGGWYMTQVNTNVTFPGRLYLSGEVNLILGDGSTLTCNGGIDVPSGSSLTIWKMKNGVGTLIATGAENCAGIGGGSGQSNGRITINGGTVNATGGQSGAGIGGGKNGSGGTITINGGTVTATGADGGAAIGGGKNGSSGSLTIADGLQVLVLSGSEPASYGDRAATCRNNNAVVVQPCGEHSYRDEHCDYCGIEVGLWNYFEMSGNEVLIKTADDWNRLATFFNEDRLHNSSYTYKLMNNITVTTMIGTADNPFIGTFDGNGKTLTFNSDDQSELVAPFRHINGATIRNLHTAGDIKVSDQRASGLIGENHGTSTVTNCRVSATISGSKLLAGFCVGTGDTLNITGCVFDGIIKRETGRASQSGCFVAWGTDGLSITDSVANLKRGTAFTGGIFCYTGGGAPTLTNCYYLTAHANVQGKQARSVTAAEGVTIDFGTPAATYSVSGITAYPAGLKYGDVFYAGEGNSLALGLSCDVPQGYQLYMYDVSAGTLAEANGAWTLTMLNANATISAVYVPVFGTPDFTLPAAITTVEEEAFLSAGMSVVLVPDSCTSISDHAFKDCAALTQIHIPAACTLGTDVFDGCTLVYVFGTSGSPAETYCQEHENCVFVEE